MLISARRCHTHKSTPPILRRIGVVALALLYGLEANAWGGGVPATRILTRPQGIRLRHRSRIQTQKVCQNPSAEPCMTRGVGLVSAPLFAKLLLGRIGFS